MCVCVCLNVCAIFIYAIALSLCIAKTVNSVELCQFPDDVVGYLVWVVKSLSTEQTLVGMFRAAQER